ncbi:HypC/HybG/HupF family hydrogenase formation chaperone [Mycobacterium sp. UM_Kg1]|uniref:HypC/HybG/HupF family hydrogenase formation chaperone n=1 Tax=Mycobacterium sp. UM_Kg1 TaxID=1545691 RepID=UPI00061B1DE2|nr:HypC/HybG/HupF family hydrogenase formation chaperone [Mycobacterium sp. UM_Kg1]
MCLGIPGMITAITDAEGYLAQVDVNGVRRTISVRLLEGELPAPGEWVLVHVGFALAKVDEAEALLTLEALQKLGDAYSAEMDDFGSTSHETGHHPQ